MKSDRDKWDRRYAASGERLPDPDPFLVEHRGQLGTGRALDLACGLGANAIFLAEHGYRVDAVDISFEALTRLHGEARSRGLDIGCIVADLDYFPLPRSAYDLVIVFAFFSEPLLEPIKSALKSDGILFYSTFNERYVSVRPGFNPAYLIQPHALVEYFSDFNVLVHEPSAGEEQATSRLIARKRRDRHMVP